MNCNNQIVQAPEVDVIARQKGPIIAHRMREVNGVILPTHANIGRNLNVVTCLPQQGNQDASAESSSR